MVGAFGAAYAFLQDAVGTLQSGGGFDRLSELFGGPGRYFAGIGLAWCGNCAGRKISRKARQQDTDKNAGTD